LILRPGAGTLFLITQPDHAGLAADLVEHFQGFAARPRRDAIHLAVREHDSGWRDLDEAIAFDDATGRPLDFMTVAETVKQEVWAKAIDAVRQTSPYAAALIAEHALFVYQANRVKPAWRGFFETLERRRTLLLADAGVSREDLTDDYRFVGLADLLSLAFCNAWDEPRERLGHTVRCAGDEVIVHPPLIGPTPVPFAVSGRRVGDKRYASLGELRAALKATPIERLTGHARSEDTPR
jgi:hypothetical protein